MTVEKGYVYILTNPSFPDYVKIGYANDVEDRVQKLNSKECTPFAFRIFATLEVPGRLKDLKLHNLIDKLNPNLRSIDNIDGKIRKREFYAMSPQDAYDILESIADIFDAGNKLKHWSKSTEDKAEENAAKTIRKLAKDRHHLKTVTFNCSLTNHVYEGRPNDDGVLEIFDLTTKEIVPNNANPSKKTILGVTLEDLGQSLNGVNTTYQRYRLLQKLLAK